MAHDLIHCDPPMTFDLKNGIAEWNTDGTRVDLMKNENFMKKNFVSTPPPNEFFGHFELKLMCYCQINAHKIESGGRGILKIPVCIGKIFLSYKIIANQDRQHNES